MPFNYPGIREKEMRGMAEKEETEIMNNRRPVSPLAKEENVYETYHDSTRSF